MTTTIYDALRAAGQNDLRAHRDGDTSKVFLIRFNPHGTDWVVYWEERDGKRHGRLRDAHCDRFTPVES
jgi:hypothetical protein